MVQPAIRHRHQVIDLVSEDGDRDHDFSDEEVAFYDAQSVGEPSGDGASVNLNGLDAFAQPEVGHEDIIDLTAIPDIDVPPSDPSLHIADDADPPYEQREADVISEAVCLQLVLDVFPDVSVEHVLTLIQERTTDLTRTKWHSEEIVNELLEGAYPKEPDAASRKRRRADSDEVSDYEKDERDPELLSYTTDAADLLKDEFLNVPVRHITNVLKQHKTLFKAYLVLEEQVRSYQRITSAFIRSPRPRNKRGAELILIERGSQLPKELRAAKKKRENQEAKRRKVEEQERAEEANLQRARITNQMGECQCCFTEYPLNRMISCGGKDEHLFCVDCPKSYIETEMGQSKCRPVCFATTDCKGEFTRQQLQQVLSEKTFERLEHMQQQQDLAAADLDFLSECPFCDFKAELPPVEVDREFRCQNTKCGKTSCRLCNKETHIPLTCDEAKKDGQLTLRHVVEEAMTAALIRKCNKCKHPFVKEYGCNKMTCSNCGNKQCYICSKNVNNYEHFGDTGRGRCALNDNVEDVHEQAVKRAAEEAMAQVKNENPGLSDADLMVQVSDRVKRAEDARRGRAAERLNEFPYEMLGDQLVNRPGFLGAAPPPPEEAAQPPRPHGRIGGVFGALAARVAADLQDRMLQYQRPNPPPRPDEPLNYPLEPDLEPRVEVRAQGHFVDIIIPHARIDDNGRAAQNRYQQQLQDANRAHNANRLRAQQQALEDQVRRMNDDLAGRRRRLQEVEERYNELRGQVEERPHRMEGRVRQRPEPVRPVYAIAEPPRHVPRGNVRQVGGGGGHGGLAFGGLDANRALDPLAAEGDGAARRREVNRWFEEQLRNVPRQ